MAECGRTLFDAMPGERNISIPECAMNAETLDANFYHQRANLCHKLADAATKIENGAGRFDS